mgnify:CR=1 FL=1
MLNTKQFPVLFKVEDLNLTEGTKKKQYIILHHSATDVGSAEIFHKYHVQHNGWKALGYHFVINNGSQLADGLIQCNMARDWDKDFDFVEEVGAHAQGLNSKSIGICCVGNFDTHFPSIIQVTSCRHLISYLCAKLSIPIANVIGHREAGQFGGSPVHKSCPGSLIDMDEARYFFGTMRVYAGDAIQYSKLIDKQSDVIFYDRKE